MNFLVLAAITTFNLAIVMSLIFSPIIIAWLSQSDAYIIAAIQFLAVYMVYRRYERHRDLVAF